MRSLILMLAVLFSFTAMADEKEKDELKLPEGSADYTRTLKLVLEYKHKKIDLKALEKKLLALKLPPHGQGDLYITAPSPMPPPGVKFEPALMPSDWLNTWGEVAMTFWKGDLSQADYETLHKAAHGKLPGFPNCKPKN
ncbi:MAG: hypothetical protein JNM17_30735 [Archangium sp.]|nr:hypothetical protein [Archangium sp.]